MRTGFERLKRNRGFTLVEMVISVAFLAVISIFLLKLFLSADNLSLKAKDLDKGVAVTKQVIETFKSCSLPEEFQAAGMMKDASLAESGTTVKLTLRFDDDWKPVAAAAGKEQPKAAFTLEASVEPETADTGSKAVRGIYIIDVKVTKTDAYKLEDKTETELYSASALKYFSRLNTGKRQ